MDERLVEFLERRFSVVRSATTEDSRRGLRLLHADAMKLLRHEPRDWHDWKIVSNLPYSVASPLLVELACGHRAPALIVATLQSEVARRLAAGPGHADYGILTLLVGADFEPQHSFVIPASCFFPAPEVESSCITLRRRGRPLIADELRPAFSRLVKRGFSQRRKMMRKLLKQDWPVAALDAALSELGIAAEERAERVSLEQFARLTELLAGSGRSLTWLKNSLTWSTSWTR